MIINKDRADNRIDAENANANGNGNGNSNSNSKWLLETCTVDDGSKNSQCSDGYCNNNSSNGLK